VSRHWDPGSTGWLSEAQFRALSPRKRRALYGARGQSKRAEGALGSFHRLMEGQRRARWPAGATAGLVLIAAACVGTAFGLYQAAGPRNPVELEARIEQGAVPAVPRRTPDAVQAEAQAEPADARWEGRASAQVIEAGLPRAYSARNGAVRASFGYCFRGGGSNCVVDGDTFWIGGDKVRIAGIDAPETHPPRCAYEARLGEQATEKLHALLNSGAVTMTRIDRDRDVYGRMLRNVQVNGADVGEAMVGAGVAREYRGGRRPWC
jgi:micrococcal nuclease